MGDIAVADIGFAEIFNGIGISLGDIVVVDTGFVEIFSGIGLFFFCFGFKVRVVDTGKDGQSPVETISV